MTGALSPLRVLELSEDLPAAYCARQFAAWGAQVTMLEPATGSPLRLRGPRFRLPSGEEVSCLWEYVAAGKASQAFSSPSALAGTASELLAATDIFVTDWPEGRLEDARLSLEEISAGHPGLITVAISPFGRFGPYAGFAGGDLVVQALASFTSFNGEAGRPPLKGPANVLAYAAGVSAFVGALAAVHERTISGLGQVVEVSCQEAVASLVQTLRSEYSGQALPRLGGPAGGTLFFRCKDGFVTFNPAADGAWSSVLAALGIDESDVPPRLRTPDGKRDRRALVEFFSPKTLQFEASALFETLNTLGVICGRLNTPADLLTDRHLTARRFFFEMNVREGSRISFPGPPARMTSTPMAPPSPAPGLVERQGVRSGTTPSRPLQAKSRADARRAPLAGVRIADLAQAWLGSYAVMLLAHLGADVIKVESPRRPDIWRGDLARMQGHFATRPNAHPWNTNPSFNSVNLDKRDVALDLSRPEGRAIFLRLVAEADIVTENFSPRVLDNLRLTYEELRKANPNLVMVSFSGFGRSGPYRDFKSNGAVTESTSGWSNYLGYPGDRPLMMGTMQADAITGLQMAACALVALVHRDFTGEGQYVEGSMFEAAVGYIGEEVLLASFSALPPSLRGNRSPDQVPHGIFAASNEDDWLALSIADDENWKRFVSVAALDGLRDQRFETVAGRVAAVEEVEALVGQWTAGLDAREAMWRLQARGIPAAVVLDTKSIFDDPHLKARKWFLAVDHPDLGPRRHNGFPWRFSRTPPQHRLPAPRLGEHTRQVLRELGFSEDQIEAFLADGVAGEVLSSSPTELP